MFDKSIFGPVQSRRFGTSLGINLLSTTHKVCNFNCVYCECGLTGDLKNISAKYADAYELLARLEATLASAETPCLDVLTYAGNGEPTLHPYFEKIAEDIRILRDRHCPTAKIVLLTNGTTLHKLSVQRALRYIDSTVVKLDAGLDKLIQRIDHPLSPYKIEDLVAQIKLLPHKIIIQTMFLRGNIDGKSVDNTTEENISSWLNWLKEIQPKEVMLYSIARNTPVESLYKVPEATLHELAMRVRSLGIKTLVT